MLEELKALLTAFDGIGEIAGWVIFGFLTVKVIIYLSTTGVIYHLIKLFITKAHDYFTSDKVVTHVHEYETVKYSDFDEICITADGTRLVLRDALQRIAGKRTNINSNYIHRASVEWLVEAITEKEQRDIKEEIDA